LCTAIAGTTTAAPRDWSDLLQNGGFRVEDGNGQVLLSYRDNDAFIPASTLKVATAFCALEDLGPEYRFTTEFSFSEKDSVLYIKGFGDPGLISEELRVMAKELSRYVKSISKVVIDTSYFSNTIVIDGASGSTNPYDARNGAFVGNFGTAMVSRRSKNEIISAEPQTPLTPLGKAAGMRLSIGATERVNLGSDARSGALYGGELLVEFLKESGTKVSGPVTLGEVSKSAHSVYVHRSSRTLSEMVKEMLRFSTNFTANQIFLVLGAQMKHPPATVEKGVRTVRECLEKRVGWRTFQINEGAGLSRKNQVTPHLMTDLLKAFERYKDLLKEENGFVAKTGSLTGVNSLAGYFELPQIGQVRFAILINSNVPHMYKYKVAAELKNWLIYHK